MPSRDRLIVLERHLGDVPGLRMEFSVEATETQVRTRSAPLFWVGLPGRDNQAAFLRLHRLLAALDCPPEILDIHLAHCARSLYQGVAVDLVDERPRGSLFIHDRVEDGERRWGHGWTGREIQRTDYQAGRLTEVDVLPVLARRVHEDLRDALVRLLSDPRLLREGGYWLQTREGQDGEIYLTHPWHPQLDSMAPLLEAALPAERMLDLERYRDVPLRHIGLASRSSPLALTFYFSAPFAGPWPRDMAELEQSVRASAARWGGGDHFAEASAPYLSRMPASVPSDANRSSTASSALTVEMSDRRSAMAVS
jgi:hypothetical protein